MNNKDKSTKQEHEEFFKSLPAMAEALQTLVLNLNAVINGLDRFLEAVKDKKRRTKEVPNDR